MYHNDMRRHAARSLFAVGALSAYAASAISGRPALRKGGLLLACLMATLPTATFSCSAFLVSSRNAAILGRTLDWDYGHGVILVNPRGLKKRALLGPPDQPAQWTSKYGSVTFNQVGREFPYGGVNEKGLDVEQLWLGSARFPAPDSRPALNELQWIQYQLDNFASVSEVLANLKKTNVVSRIAPIHYFICDASGACAAVEGIAGKLVVHKGRSLPIRALTNDTYSDSLSYSKRFLVSRDTSGLPAGTKSLARFARLGYLLASRRAPAEGSIEGAFAKLSDVSSPKSDGDDGATQWRIVQDLKGKTIYFETLKDSTEKAIDLSRIDFSCAKPAQALDVDIQASGNVNSRFADYTMSQNSDLVGRSLSTGFAHLSPETIRKIAEYPGSFVCGK